MDTLDLNSIMARMIQDQMDAVTRALNEAEQRKIELQKALDKFKVDQEKPQ